MAVYLRQHDGDTILALNNLCPSAETVQIPKEYQRAYLNLFAGDFQTLSAQLTLQPYSYMWLEQLK